MILKVLTSLLMLMIGSFCTKFLLTAVFISNSYFNGLYTEFNNTLYRRISVPAWFLINRIKEPYFIAIFMFIYNWTFGSYLFVCCSLPWGAFSSGSLIFIVSVLRVTISFAGTILMLYDSLEFILGKYLSAVDKFCWVFDVFFSVL